MPEQEITFDNFDKFERKDFAKRLSTVVSKFYPFFSESFVLSLNAKFGSGKTTFLKMWKQSLETDQYTVIYINAWETDYNEEPLIPLIAALLTQIKTKKSAEKTKKTLMTAMAAASITVSQISEHFTGFNADEVAKQTSTYINKNNLETLGEQIYESYSYKVKAYTALKEALTNYVLSIPKKPLIIFVDELDRVRPDYAVKFLEAIKHIFSIHGICFVLAVDRAQLEISIRELYGQIDFENYYLRFVTREAHLPEIYETNITNFIRHKAEEFFETKIESEIYFPFTANEQANILEYMSINCSIFGFTARQIENLFRIFSQFMAVSTKDKRTNLEWVNASIFLISIFINKKSIYHAVGRGTLKANEFYNYIVMLFDNSSSQNKKDHRYFLLSGMSYCLNSENRNQVADLCIKYDPKFAGGKDLKEQQQNVIEALIKPLDRYGSIHENSVLKNIYKLLEDWKTLIN